MVSVSISHSDFIFIPRDFFAQIYLYWPPHRISHFKFASQILHAICTNCCANTQRGYKRSCTKTRGTCIQSSFKISTVTKQQEGSFWDSHKTCYRTGNHYFSFTKILGIKPDTQPEWGALGCWVLWVGSGQKQGGQSQDAAGGALWWIYSCLFISIFSSIKFSFYGQTGKVYYFLKSTIKYTDGQVSPGCWPVVMRFLVEGTMLTSSHTEPLYKRSVSLKNPDVFN